MARGSGTVTGGTTSAHESVEALLESFFAERIARAAASDESYATLWHAIQEAARGGKRLRPQLVLLAHRAFGGTSHDDALVAAAAIELVHTALLFHDDVLDGDLVRRGRPNLQGRFTTDAMLKGLVASRATAWGEAAGVLAGDLLISAAHTLISRMASPQRPLVHEIVDETMFVTADGELTDVGLGLGTVSATGDGIARMMAAKTAHYSFASPLRVGAVLAGASEEDTRELASIGMSLGFIYQLRDDALGVFGRPETSGKSVDSDLREGKRTLLISYAESSPEWREVRHLFGRRTMDADDADRLRSALVASGAVQRVSALLQERGEQLRERIGASGLPAPLRTELDDLTRRCAERDA